MKNRILGALCILFFVLVLRDYYDDGCIHAFPFGSACGTAARWAIAAIGLFAIGGLYLLWRGDK